MNVNLFLMVFVLIFLAEMPDKTAFAAFLMATRGKSRAVFLGAAAAFLIQSVVAVAFGSLIGTLPDKWVHTGAGLLFLGVAGHAWLSKDGEDCEPVKGAEGISKRAAFWSVVWKSFLVIFIAEWGDLTQLATASLAARYHEFPVTIFCSATLALWVVTALAVFVGKKLGKAVNMDVIKKVSTVLFAGIGIFFIVTAWL